MCKCVIASVSINIVSFAMIAPFDELMLILPSLQTPQQFSKEYEAYANNTNVKTSLYGPFGFDAAWMVAIALNSSKGKSSSLQRLHISQDNTSEEIKKSLLRTRFRGVTVSALENMRFCDSKKTLETILEALGTIAIVGLIERLLNILKGLCNTLKDKIHIFISSMET